MANPIRWQQSSRLGGAQQVTLSAVSAASAAFGPETYQIRVCLADVAGSPTSIRFRIGDGTPTAVSTDPALPSNAVEYFTVTPGQKIAAVLVGGTSPSAQLTVAEIA
jgi:hypothetical protein